MRDAPLESPGRRRVWPGKAAQGWKAAPLQQACRPRALSPRKAVVATADGSFVWTIENDRLADYSAVSIGSSSPLGNIYLGKLVNIEPSIQAAFVAFGRAPERAQRRPARRAALQAAA